MSDVAGNFKATIGNGTLSIVDSGSEGGLTATINNQRIGKWGLSPNVGDMTIDTPMSLSGSFKEYTQQNGPEKFFLVSLSGQGQANDGSAENPAVLSLAGVLRAGELDRLTVQYASGFEFRGLAEGIWGGQIAWERVEASAPSFPNPLPIQIPAKQPGQITAEANAAFIQRVTLTFLNEKHTLQGNGDGRPMTTPDGQRAITLPSQEFDYEIQALFEFQREPNGPFANASVRTFLNYQQGNFHWIKVTTEDATDNDDNDTYLTIVTTT